MIRLLLAGVKPQEILALTFTRKAAQEMRDRLYGLLEDFSTADDVTLINELQIRGLTKEEAIQSLPQARALYIKVLSSPQAIVIDTFHGWFGRLLGAAPVSAGVQPGFNLREDAKRLQEECMGAWWGNLPEDLKNHYDVLLAEFGASETQKFLMGNYSLFKQRGAWIFSKSLYCSKYSASGLFSKDLASPCQEKSSRSFWGLPGTKRSRNALRVF